MSKDIDLEHLCELCGEPMPIGEKTFRYHGFSGDCPKPYLSERLDGTTVNRKLIVVEIDKILDYLKEYRNADSMIYAVHYDRTKSMIAKLLHQAEIIGRIDELNHFHEDDDGGYYYLNDNNDCINLVSRIERLQTLKDRSVK